MYSTYVLLTTFFLYTSRTLCQVSNNYAPQSVNEAIRSFNQDNVNHNNNNNNLHHTNGQGSHLNYGNSNDNANNLNNKPANIEEVPLPPELEANLEEILMTASQASPFNFALPSMQTSQRRRRFPSPARVIERIRMATAASGMNSMPVMITIPPHVLQDTYPASAAIIAPDEGCRFCNRQRNQGLRSPSRFRNRNPSKMNPGRGGNKGGGKGGYSNFVGNKGGFQPVNRGNYGGSQGGGYGGKGVPPPPAQSIKGGSNDFRGYSQKQLRLADSKKIVVVVLQVNKNDKIGFGGGYGGGKGGNQYRREDYVPDQQQQQMMYAPPVDENVFLDIIENIHNNGEIRSDASHYLGPIAMPTTTSTTIRPSSSPFPSMSPFQSMPFVESSDREIITQEKEDETSYASSS